MPTTPTLPTSTVTQACAGLTLKSRGYALDQSDEALGFLNEFHDNPVANVEEARAAFVRDGYLYIKGFWPREGILAVRRKLCDRMAAMGVLKSGHAPLEAIPQVEGIHSADKVSASLEGVVENVPEIQDFLYRGRIVEFFGHFLGGEILHYDYIWFRAMAPGFGTVPHCDLVYMGRGTANLYTAWVPWGDIDLRTGGLIILEESQKKSEQIGAYLRRDVDEYCMNRAIPKHLDLQATTDNKVWGGWLSKNPVTLREKLGGRWLTSPHFEMGDVLIFSTKLVHASLDNQSDHFRMSSDTRYQRADEPADERWVGTAPRGHVGYHKRGRVC